MRLNHIYPGDCLATLKAFPDNSAHCCICSPPYYGLRSYTKDDSPEKIHEIGLEETPEAYIEKLVAVFREVRRVLRPDGTLWLNLGDSYANDGKWGGSSSGKHIADLHGDTGIGRNRRVTGLKPKDQMMIPHRVAIALQMDGWWVRQTIIWSKTNGMPEAVTDRCTNSHEYIFLLAKSERYFFDSVAIKEPNSSPAQLRHNQKYAKSYEKYDSRTAKTEQPGNINNAGIHSRPGEDGRNRRSVWTLSNEPFAGAHFATYPTELIKPCVLAGTSAYGCCAECGKPYERVINKVGKSIPVEERTGRQSHNGMPPQTSGYFWKGPTTQATSDFQKACTCETNEVKPCVILDPFMGAGTTALVAASLGRHYVGCELSPANITLAENRLYAELGTFSPAYINQLQIA